VKSRFVLDAWAVLSLLQAEEPAATRVRTLIGQASGGSAELSISVINLSEVFYRVGRLRGEREAALSASRRRFGEAEEILSELRALPWEVLAASDERVWAAARIKMRHRVSLADAFAAAAAVEQDATLVTGDPELCQLGAPVRVEKLARR